VVFGIRLGQRPSEPRDLANRLRPAAILQLPSGGRGPLKVRVGSEPALHQGGRRLRVLIFVELWWTVPDIVNDFIRELTTARQPTAKRFDESLVALSPLGLRGGEGGVGQGWGAGQLEADKDGERLVRNVDMALNPLEMAAHAIQSPRQCCFEPIGAVGRQVRHERCFYDQGLRNALAGGVVGKLVGKVPWKAEGMLGSHGHYIPRSRTSTRAEGSPFPP